MFNNKYDGQTHDSGKEFNALAASNKPTFSDILIECASLLHAHIFDYFYVLENHRSKMLLAVRPDMDSETFEAIFQPDHAKEEFDELSEEPGYEGYSYYDYYIETPYKSKPFPVVLFSCNVEDDKEYFWNKCGLEPDNPQSRYFFGYILPDKSDCTAINRIADIICDKIETREMTTTGCEGTGYDIRWTINLDIPTEEYKKLTADISYDELAEEVDKRLASMGYENLLYDGDVMPAKWAGARGVPELAYPSPIAYLYDKKKHYYDCETDEWL